MADKEDGGVGGGGGALPSVEGKDDHMGMIISFLVLAAITVVAFSIRFCLKKRRRKREDEEDQRYMREMAEGDFPTYEEADDAVVEGEVHREAVPAQEAA